MKSKVGAPGSLKSKAGFASALELAVGAGAAGVIEAAVPGVVAAGAGVDTAVPPKLGSGWGKVGDEQVLLCPPAEATPPS